MVGLGVGVCVCGGGGGRWVREERSITSKWHVSRSSLTTFAL